MGLPECDTPLVWIMIFTRSSGATAVLAHAPAVPPDSSSYGTHRIRERGQTQQGGTGQSPRRAEPSRAAAGGGGEGDGRKVTHLDDGVGVPQGSISRPTFRLERPRFLACSHLGAEVTPFTAVVPVREFLHFTWRVTGSGGIRYDTQETNSLVCFGLSSPYLYLTFHYHYHRHRQPPAPHWVP